MPDQSSSANLPTGTPDAGGNAPVPLHAAWLGHPQAIRTIFFDIGFTLLHPHPSVPSIVQQACAHEGVTIPIDALAQRLPFAERHFFSAQHVHRRTWADNQAITTAWLAFFAEMIRPFIPPDDALLLERCTRATVALFDQHHAWQMYDDVLPTLEALHGRYTLGAISDWGISLGAILRELGLSRYFAVLVVSATSRRAKPDPHLFETALQRADALGDYTLYIGDSYIQDVLGARAVGINPILLDRRQRLQPGEVDCVVIHSLSEIVTLLAPE